MVISLNRKVMALSLKDLNFSVQYPQKYLQGKHQVMFFIVIIRFNLGNERWPI
jgi:hypothetical protein